MHFTWNTENLCIVFRWWHISGPVSLIFSLLAIVALGAAYEALRSASRRYEIFVNKRSEELTSKHTSPEYFGFGLEIFGFSSS
jgi:copper transporter 1